MSGTPGVRPCWAHDEKKPAEAGFFDGSLKQIKPPSDSRITSCQQQERLAQQRQLAWHQQQERLAQQEPQQLEQQQELERLEQRLLLFYRKRPKQQQQ